MSSAQSDYHYQLELFVAPKNGGDPQVVEVQPPDASRCVSTVALESVDWQPALECALWAATRKQPRRPIVLDTSDGIIEPSWHPTFGPPYIDGVEVSFGNGSETPQTLKVPVTFFGSAASTASESLVRDGTVSDGETLRYRVSAYPQQRQPRPQGDLGGAFTVESNVPALVVEEASIKPLMDRAELCDEGASDEMPVFVRLATTLSVENVRSYLPDVPRDANIVSVEPVVRQVSRVHRYLNTGQ